MELNQYDVMRGDVVFLVVSEGSTLVAIVSEILNADTGTCSLLVIPRYQGTLEPTGLQIVVAAYSPDSAVLTWHYRSQEKQA